jgi:hypothetical protein
MLRHLRAGLLALGLAALLAGCMGWAHPMWGGHNRWDDDHPHYGPGSRCTEEQRTAGAAGSGGAPCPYERR